MTVRRAAARAGVAAALALGGLTAAPAEAALPMRFWVEYAGMGTVAFACHNVAAIAGTNPQLGNGTRVWCSLNGFPSARVTGGGAHATSAGLANASLGQTVQVCIEASTVYGFPHMNYYAVDVCVDVVLGPAGTVFI
jgi:hypothetical protein